MLTSNPFHFISSFLKKSLTICFAFFLFAKLSHAHTTVCKDKLGDLAYSHFTPVTSRVAGENSRNFKESAEAGTVLGKHPRLNALHILNPKQRFPEGAPIHAVIFDRFGFNPNDFTSAQNKVKSLTSKNNTGEKIPMGAEAFSPSTHLFNVEAAAQWMKSVLLEVASQNPDGRPTVIYARGALCEVAAYLAHREPQLFAALVLENPRSGFDHTSIPAWDKNSFTVPTYILTGSHDGAYIQALKQKLYNLSRNSVSPDGQRRLHYMDMPFAKTDVFADNEKGNAKDLPHQEVYRFLNKHVLAKKYPDEENTSPERFVEIAQSRGIGTRRWFGHKPKPTPQNEINAIRAGVLMWELPIKAVSSIEEARAHIAMLETIKEKPENGIINRPVFFISNHPNLKKLSSSQNLEEALGLLNGDPLNLIREAAQTGNKFFEIGEDGSVKDYSPQDVLDAPIEAVYLDDNKNGFVFNASGWALPVIRGMMDIERAKESHAYKTGRILFTGPMDRKGKITKPGIAGEGFYFKKNTNLAGVLEELRKMKRKGQSENATRFLDPYNIILMQRLFEAGLLETFELYNPKGELVAGGINVKIDNVLSPETVFYPTKAANVPEDAPESQKLEGVDYAKIVVTYMIDDAARAGHTKMDSQIVSSLTILFSPKYVRTDTEFLPFVKSTNEGWETYQRKLEEQRKAEHDQHAARFEPKRLEIAALEAHLEATAADYALAREKAEKLKFDRDISEEEKADPGILAQIAVSRDAKKEARRLEMEVVQLKAKLEAILSEFVPTSSVLSNTEIHMLIGFAREKADKAKLSFEEATIAAAKTAEAYNKAIEAKGEDSPEVATLKVQVDKDKSRIAGFRNQYDEARGRIIIYQQILSTRGE